MHQNSQTFRHGLCDCCSHSSCCYMWFCPLCAYTDLSMAIPEDELCCCVTCKKPDCSRWCCQFFLWPFCCFCTLFKSSNAIAKTLGLQQESGGCGCFCQYCCCTFCKATQIAGQLSFKNRTEMIYQYPEAEELIVKINKNCGFCGGIGSKK